MSAYCMVQIDVHNADEYAKYAALAGPAVAMYGGEFLARGGKSKTLEGNAHQRNVVIRFPDFETAERFYDGQEYQEALAFALAEGVSTRSYTIVDGV